MGPMYELSLAELQGMREKLDHSLKHVYLKSTIFHGEALFFSQHKRLVCYEYLWSVE